MTSSATSAAVTAAEMDRNKQTITDTVTGI